MNGYGNGSGARTGNTLMRDVLLHEVTLSRAPELAVFNHRGRLEPTGRREARPDDRLRGNARACPDGNGRRGVPGLRGRSIRTTGSRCPKRTLAGASGGR